MITTRALEANILSGRARSGTATTLKDDLKDMTADAFKNKYIKIKTNSIEYIRKISANTKDTFTFDAIVAAVSAQAVYETTAAGKITIKTAQAGAFGNGYVLAPVAATGASKPTVAAFADGVLTITLGTDAGAKSAAALGSSGVNEIAIEALEETEDAGYSIGVDIATEADAELAIDLADKVFTIMLATDEMGAPDDTKNTAAAIVALLNETLAFNALFVATATDPTGVYDSIINAVDINGGTAPAINASASDIKTAVEAIKVEGASIFAGTVNTEGAMAVPEAPIVFAGGIDAVTPQDRDEYVILAL